MMWWCSLVCGLCAVFWQPMWTVCEIKCVQLMCYILDFNVWTVTGSLFMWIKCGIKSVFVNSVWNQICCVNSVWNQISFVNFESIKSVNLLFCEFWAMKNALFFNLYTICAKCFVRPLNTQYFITICFKCVCVPSIFSDTRYISLKCFPLWVPRMNTRYLNI
jgi:hypothetical protein